MKKLLIVFFTLLFTPVLSLAQESVGFSDPDDIQPLLDYRLPEWGYTNLYWDFSLNGIFNTSHSDDQQSSSDHQFSGQLSPNYIRFRESEPRVSTYILSPVIDYSFRDRSSINNNEEYNSDLLIGLDWQFSEKIYFDDSDVFFTAGFSGNFRQTRIRNEEDPQVGTGIDETVLNRDFNPDISMGIGYGRLRSINPIIRSLRMNERFNALNTGQTLNRQDILEAAGQFTRYNGYRQIFDRPQKHFWGDMDNLLSANLSALDAFDLLYLTDVTQETIGSRREGWQISANATLRYSVDYSHAEDGITGGSSSQLSHETFFTPSVAGSWYKNLSLKHQIGITGSFQYIHQFQDESPLDTRHILNASASWLYTITDRILANTTVGYIRFDRELYASDIISIASDINYFLEDRFSLFINPRFVYQPKSFITFTNNTITNSFDEKSFVFDAGLRYYMKRGLF